MAKSRGRAGRPLVPLKKLRADLRDITIKVTVAGDFDTRPYSTKAGKEGVMLSAAGSLSQITQSASVHSAGSVDGFWKCNFDGTNMSHVSTPHCTTSRPCVACVNAFYMKSAGHHVGRCANLRRFSALGSMIGDYMQNWIEANAAWT